MTEQTKYKVSIDSYMYIEADNEEQAKHVAEMKTLNGGAEDCNAYDCRDVNTY